MKKGVFGSWFRELATLIFTQTIQAFLLAIVMTIVITAMGATTNSTGDASNPVDSQNTSSAGTNYAAGMLAIIALSQFGKVELLVKNIFGVTSAYGGDMQSGKGGLLAGAMALRYGKKVLNNAGKVAGGVGGAIKNTSQIHSLNKQKDALSLAGDTANAEGAAQDALNSMDDAAGRFIDNAATGAGMATGAQMVGGSSGTGIGTGVSAAQIDQLIQAVKQQTATLQKSKNDSDKDKLDEKMKALDDKIDEAKKNRREGIRTAASGVLETAAAAPGAAIGATVALGLGDTEKLAEYTVIGAGVGDSIASGTMKAGGKIHEGAIDLNKQHKDNVKLDNRIKELNNKKNSAINEKNMYDSITKNLEKASKNKNYMNNSTSNQRARVVKKLQENTKSKYNASNMQ